MAFTKFMPITFLLGMCASIASSAGPTPTFSSLISVESPIAVVTHAILPNGTFSNNLPPDPYYLRPYPESNIVAVQFSKYTPGIPPVYALQCIAGAQRDTALQTFRLRSLRAIGQLLSYRFGTVTLTVNPGNSVKWGYWELILSVMPELFAEYEYVGFDFIILVNNAPAGLGSLSWRA
ncbi:hypothetical protein JMJ35_006736 [Cladonia borealis]|uniref:Uncharacterized protein n=1 Tax=Cladonia borealis TaxID=184061 RepID=A0AA39V4E8_9LECA|nr:hypothetical protein JMJ35_006736 [Cladonia borealis]